MGAGCAVVGRQVSVDFPPPEGFEVRDGKSKRGRKGKMRCITLKWTKTVSDGVVLVWKSKKLEASGVCKCC